MSIDLEKLFKIPGFLENVIIGCGLGDLHIRSFTDKFNSWKKTAWIETSQSKDKHPEYIQHLFNIFKKGNLIHADKTISAETTPGKTVLKSYPVERIVSKTSASLFLIYKDFYPRKIDNPQKIVPYNIRNLLNPISIAYWFMDDGSYKATESKAILFCTNNFDIYQVFVLCDIFWRKFQIFASPRHQKNVNWEKNKKEGKNLNYADEKNWVYQVFLSGLFFDKINNLISEYLIPEIINAKWPKTKTEKSYKASPWNMKPINKGRYRREIIKGNGTQVTIVEKILNYDQNKVEWQFEATLAKNDVFLFLEKYNQSPNLNEHAIFKNWI